MNVTILKYKEQISLGSLYTLYSNDVYRYSFSILKDGDDAKDAVHETFARYAENQGSFKGDCAPKTWLLIIARNYCFNILKSRNYNNEHIEDDKHYGAYTSSYETKISIDEALKQLPPDFTELFYLKEYEGYSYKEIAEITELTLENVKIKLYRARQILRKILSD